MDYDSNDWIVTANIDSLYTTGEVTLSFEEKSIPEPSTVTLSLLALAGLCARRRRKN